MRKSNEHSLGEVIRQLIDSYRLGDKLHEVKITRAWEELMGAAISNRTSKIYIKEKVLIIKVTSAPLREELTFQKPRILDLMNRELGDKYLVDVVIS